MTIPKGKKIVFLSGQVAWDKNLKVVEAYDLAKQTNMVYQNIESALNEIGVTWDQISKTNCLLQHCRKNMRLLEGQQQVFLVMFPSSSNNCKLTGLVLP